MKYLAVLALVVSLGLVHCGKSQGKGQGKGQGQGTANGLTKKKCFCPQFDISPVCDLDGNMYQSPCAAKCAKVKELQNCVDVSFDEARADVEKWVKEAYNYGQLGVKYGQEAYELGENFVDEYGDYIQAVAKQLLG